MYKGVGKNGIVTVGRSQTSYTHFETTNGLKVERGFSSNIFIRDQKKDECIFDDVYILVSAAEISNILQIENILKPILTDNKKLLIIAPCSTNVVNTLAANKMKRDIKVCTIPPPNFGYKQHELMQDIAISVGATYYSEKTGDDVERRVFGGSWSPVWPSSSLLDSSPISNLIGVGTYATGMSPGGSSSGSMPAAAS